MKKGSKTFPVMITHRVDTNQVSDVPVLTQISWEFIQQFEKIAQTFHTQTLERLAERGGLSVCEIMAVVTNNRGWWHESEERALTALRGILAAWGLPPTCPQCGYSATDIVKTTE